MAVGAGWLGTGRAWGRGGGCGLLLPPAVSTVFPYGAVVVGVVIVTGLGLSQQGCGLGEGGRNPQALVCQCVCVSGGV